MTNALKLITGIEARLLELKDQQVGIRKENEEYRQEIVELKRNQEEQNRIIRQLEEKINTLRITKTIETKEGAAEAKERITKLVREIDHCIGLLNT